MYVSGMYQRLVLVVIVSAPDALVVILMKVLCYCRVTFRLRRRLRGPSAISQSVVVKNRYVMISRDVVSLILTLLNAATFQYFYIH